MSDSMDAKGAVPDGTQESASYLRLPWYVVTAALVLVVGGTLAFGLYATRASREPVAAPPTPLPSATAAATPIAATVVPLAAPTVTVAPTPLVVNLAPTATAVPAPVTAGAPTETVTALPRATPTLDPSTAAEVTAAFQRYWDVRIQALLELDKTHLNEVMAGDHLRVIAQRIDELRAQNRAIKTDVDHDIQIIEVTPTYAQLVDDYISNSVYVEATTREPLSEPTSDELRVLYRLEKTGGTWRVIDSVQAE